MTGSVHPDAPWRHPWQSVDGAAWQEIKSQVEELTRGELPQWTRIHRQRLSCFPQHTLYRFEVGSTEGPRVAYAFHAPGQLHPLDWTTANRHEFEDEALEVRTPAQAEDWLRFTVWTTVREHGRSFIVSQPRTLRRPDGSPLDAETRGRLEAHLHDVQVLPPRDDDGPEVHRFRAPLLYAGEVRDFEFVVAPPSRPSGVEADDSFEPIEIPGAVDVVDGERFFVLVPETSLTAERFLRRLRSGPVHQARVTEPVSLRNEVFEHPVTLRQVTFQHGADFDGARFAQGLTLDRCVVEGRLGLRDAVVEGSLHAPRLTFHRDGARRDDASLQKRSRYGEYAVDLDASAMRVSGSVYLEGLRAVHVVDLSRARVEGDVRLGGARIGTPPETPGRPNPEFRLRMDRMRIDGELDFTFAREPATRLAPEIGEPLPDPPIHGWAYPRTVVRGSIQAMGMRVGQEISLGGLRCEGNLEMNGLELGADIVALAHPPWRRLIVLGDFRLDRSTIHGDLLLDGIHVGGDLALYSCRIEGSIFGRLSWGTSGRQPRLTVGGELSLSGTRVDDVDLAGAKVGTLEAVTGDFGRLRLVAGAEQWPPAGPDDEGPRTLRPCRFEARGIDLVDLSVRKRIEILARVGAGGLQLGNLDCGGDLELWFQPATDPDEVLREGEAWLDGRRPALHQLATEVEGDLLCTGVRVEGRAVFTNVRAPGRRILLKNCVVAQDLVFTAWGADPFSHEDRTRTECRELDLELTRCGGDVDLSGLRVSAGGGIGRDDREDESEGGARDGAPRDPAGVHARQLDVSGRILFGRPLGRDYDRLDQLDPMMLHGLVAARIEGDVDLSVAQAAHLLLDGMAVDGRVNLERARFRRLQVLSPAGLDGHNLTHIQVDRWDLADSELGKFLDGSDPFDRATYVAVERVLRNRAQDAEADRVYRAMRDRAIREAEIERWRQAGASAGEKPRRPGRAFEKHRWWHGVTDALSYRVRTTGSRIMGFLYGWGTLHWAPLFVFSLFAVPFSWGLFADPANIVASPDLAAAAGLPVETAGPAAYGVDWGPSDGFWLTVRYHVPVVPLAAREDFRPSQQLAVLTVPGAGRWRFAFSAESWAFTVYLMNWVLWPLFLVGLARRVVRETT